MTVYIDSVFLLNTITDYLLFLAAARLAGIPLRRGRYMLAALLGGGYAVAVFLPEGAFLVQAPVKIAVGILLALVAYGGETQLLRLTLLWFAVSCGFAGAVLGLGLLLGGIPVIQGIFYTDINTKVLAAAFAAGYFLFSVVFRTAAKHGIQEELLPVQIRHFGRMVELTALWDSGHGLRDPVSGASVLILAPGQLDSMLSAAVRSLVTEERLRQPAELLEPLLRTAPELRPRLLPYRTVGNTGGLLLTIQVEQVCIGRERYEHVRVALSPTPLGSGYGALWGGNVEKGGRYEAFQKHMEKTDGAVGGTAG